jgi:hypothetical protein
MMHSLRSVCRWQRACARCYHSTNAAFSSKHRHAPFEEEQLPWYNQDQFYPVRVGEILENKYKVIGKLDYGAQSTVWLCRNVL